jgi:hypothetical protein
MSDLQWAIVQPILRGVREHSYFTALHARSIIKAVTPLPVVPGYETKARDLLGDAESELAIALDLVRQARAKYDTLPVIVETLVAAE